jgi:hypothetical protein
VVSVSTIGLAFGHRPRLGSRTAVRRALSRSRAAAESSYQDR